MDDKTLRRQDAAADQPLGLFRDDDLVEVLPAGTIAYEVPHRPGHEVLALCPTHPTASAVDCLSCEPV